MDNENHVVPTSNIYLIIYYEIVTCDYRKINC